MSKERVTLLVGANSHVSEKLPLLLIGKAKKKQDVEFKLFLCNIKQIEMLG